MLHNLVSLCACHHERGVHGGLLRVYGDAEDVLTWELGCRPWMEPLLVFRRQAKAAQAAHPESGEFRAA